MNSRDYTILYVDDDQANRVVMKHNLGAEFGLLLADSGPAALEILASERVAVLLTDQRMPLMSGVDLAERVRQLYPDIIRVIITAYSDLGATVDAINRAQVARFIKKPWTREELVAVMRESVQAYHNARLLLKLQEKVRQLDRMTALAVVGSSIAHEIKQPLALIEPGVDSLRAALNALLPLELPRLAGAKISMMGEIVQDLEQQVARLKLITESLLKSLRGRTQKRELLDLCDVVQSAVSLMRSTVKDRALLDVHLPSSLVRVRASEGPLIQLLVNLLLNAVQALPQDTVAMKNRIIVRLQSVDHQALLAVEDTGAGIPVENLLQIFTPFFTTKGDEGTGMGLAICKQIVDENGGTIEVQSVVGRGTTFTVMFPLSR